MYQQNMKAKIIQFITKHRANLIRSSLLQLLIGITMQFHGIEHLRHSQRRSPKDTSAHSLGTKSDWDFLHDRRGSNLEKFENIRTPSVSKTVIRREKGRTIAWLKTTSDVKAPSLWSTFFRRFLLNIPRTHLSRFEAGTRTVDMVSTLQRQSRRLRVKELLLKPDSITFNEKKGFPWLKAGNKVEKKKDKFKEDTATTRGKHLQITSLVLKKKLKSSMWSDLKNASRSLYNFKHQYTRATSPLRKSNIYNLYLANQRDRRLFFLLKRARQMLFVRIHDQEEHVRHLREILQEERKMTDSLGVNINKVTRGLSQCLQWLRAVLDGVSLMGEYFKGKDVISYLDKGKISRVNNTTSYTQKALLPLQVKITVSTNTSFPILEYLFQVFNHFYNAFMYVIRGAPKAIFEALQKYQKWNGSRERDAGYSVETGRSHYEDLRNETKDAVQKTIHLAIHNAEESRGSLGTGSKSLWSRSDIKPLSMDVLESLGRTSVKAKRETSVKPAPQENMVVEQSDIYSINKRGGRHLLSYPQPRPNNKQHANTRQTKHGGARKDDEMTNDFDKVPHHIPPGYSDSHPGRLAAPYEDSSRYELRRRIKNRHRQNFFFEKSSNMNPLSRDIRFDRSPLRQSEHRSRATERQKTHRDKHNLPTVTSEPQTNDKAYTTDQRYGTASRKWSHSDITADKLRGKLLALLKILHKKRLLSKSDRTVLSRPLEKAHDSKESSTNKDLGNEEKLADSTLSNILARKTENQMDLGLGSGGSKAIRLTQEERDLGFPFHSFRLQQNKFLHAEPTEADRQVLRNIELLTRRVLAADEDIPTTIDDGGEIYQTHDEETVSTVTDTKGESDGAEDGGGENGAFSDESDKDKNIMKSKRRKRREVFAGGQSYSNRGKKNSTLKSKLRGKTQVVEPKADPGNNLKNSVFKKIHEGVPGLPSRLSKYYANERVTGRSVSVKSVSRRERAAVQVDVVDRYGNKLRATHEEQMMNNFSQRWAKLRPGLKKMQRNISKGREKFEESERQLVRLLKKGDKLANMVLVSNKRSRVDEAMRKAAFKNAETEFRRYKADLKLQQRKTEAKEYAAMTDDISKKISLVKNVLAKQRAYQDAKEETEFELGPYAPFSFENRNAVYKVKGRDGLHDDDRYVLVDEEGEVEQLGSEDQAVNRYFEGDRKVHKALAATTKGVVTLDDYKEETKSDPDLLKVDHMLTNLLQRNRRSAVVGERNADDDPLRRLEKSDRDTTYIGDEEKVDDDSDDGVHDVSGIVQNPNLDPILSYAFEKDIPTGDSDPDADPADILFNNLGKEKDTRSHREKVDNNYQKNVLPAEFIPERGLTSRVQPNQIHILDSRLSTLGNSKTGNDGYLEHSPMSFSSTTSVDDNLDILEKSKSMEAVPADLVLSVQFPNSVMSGKYDRGGLGKQNAYGKENELNSVKLAVGNNGLGGKRETHSQRYTPAVSPQNPLGRAQEMFSTSRHPLEMGDVTDLGDINDDEVDAQAESVLIRHGVFPGDGGLLDIDKEMQKIDVDTAKGHYESALFDRNRNMGAFDDIVEASIGNVTLADYKDINWDAMERQKGEELLSQKERNDIDMDKKKLDTTFAKLEKAENELKQKLDDEEKNAVKEIHDEIKARRKEQKHIDKELERDEKQKQMEETDTKHAVNELEKEMEQRTKKKIEKLKTKEKELDRALKEKKKKSGEEEKLAKEDKKVKNKEDKESDRFVRIRVDNNQTMRDFLKENKGGRNSRYEGRVADEKTKEDLNGEGVNEDIESGDLEDAEKENQEPTVATVEGGDEESGPLSWFGFG
ncbi:uncharacterized protein LOC101862892 isoform X2 [Aplysia californica]|uniref:Uncharacterized protein LOC101862892 isoform X2 n=1 Tax=Aplysia californica TaxID=6500 RepID=A0ABM1A882_APLCA|nr:uncharacterized protein LOC101862892 isoform X2 [Aplysia californica]